VITDAITKVIVNGEVIYCKPNSVKYTEGGPNMIKVMFVCHDCKEKIIYSIHQDERHTLEAGVDIMVRAIQFEFMHSGHKIELGRNDSGSMLWGLEHVEYDG
jgi:hypothetical protein